MRPPISIRGAACSGSSPPRSNAAAIGAAGTAIHRQFRRLIDSISASSYIGEGLRVVQIGGRTMQAIAPTALVVEDSQFLRRYLHLRLESSGWKVVEAPDAFEGLKAFREAQPDLI